MIKKIKYIVSKINNPYHNLAIEKHLLENVNSHEVVLFLWQNENTIVCGRNQNIWKECNVTDLIKDNGYVARRLSGGGCVFHDMGNLNFTFVSSKDNYDLEKQLNVIAHSCQMAGINTMFSGRNDLLADGKKFSGSAFHEEKGNKFHHGTIMVDVDVNKLAGYLNVDKRKYESKGVDSVKSRVCNLKEFDSNLTIEKMKSNLIESFGLEYGLTPEKTEIEPSVLEKDILMFSSKDWLFGNNIKFNVEFDKRFPQGDINLRLFVEKGIIKNITISSDSMNETVVLNAQNDLKGFIGTEYDESKIEMFVNMLSSKI